ncbi:DEAD/DEAH box helicase [Luteimicrobium sp. NPDC057192]|uniref:DEAD/DEAH box helicase n=1 Tax=Luteimicrobium sp. NPDC057192 TaxID=3346042 RepID=UPI00363C34D6
MPDGAPSPLLDVLLGGGRRAESVRHVEVLPAREGVRADWPSWADPQLVAGYRELGVERPWAHQATAAEALHERRHVALATSTGSGKSLAFWLPALTAVREDARDRAAASVLEAGRIETAARRGSVLYLCPTKALAADQLSALERVLDASRRAGGGTKVDLRVATCDGDTGFEERQWVRDHADVVLTNPDFLHFALLPDHKRWARLLRSLRYVVVDEGHAYRGVFGAHVALVLRRLRRLAAYYARVPGAAGTGGPTFAVASATTADPAATAARLIGVAPEDVLTVDDDASPVGRKTFVLWEPPELPGGSPLDAAAALRHAGETSSDGGTVTAATDGGRAATDAALVESLVVDPTAHDDLGLVDEPDAPAVVGDAPDRPRRSATAEASHLLADLVASGARTLAFTRSRRGAESVASATQDHLRHALGGEGGADGDLLARSVAAYRGGFLPEERRELEEALRTGLVRGLATTNALELGVDVSGLDAVLVAGWPGTRMSLWQQAGRAGRAGAEGLVAFLAREDPLDTYLVHHPEAIFDAPLESTVFDPTNPYVLAPHLCAAAAELPLRADELDRFGDPAHLRELLDVLVARGALRRRTSGWYWTHARSAAAMADLRGSGGAPVRVVEEETGRLLGTVDAGSADGTLHPGAVYVHQGRTFVVTALEAGPSGELEVAIAEPATVDYGTWSRTTTSIRLASEQPLLSRTWPARRPRADGDAASADGDVHWGYGPVEVTSQVVSFQRRHLPDLRILSTEDLELPERTLPTMAVWWSVPTRLLEDAGLTEEGVPGALHAAEHASIGLLPLLATCDRWDLGGVSTALHVDTERATVFVYDGLAGGAGFAERGYHLGATWLRATRDAIRACPCADGCPACVQSPKCGNYNNPLDKHGALRLLDAVLAKAPH